MRLTNMFSISTVLAAGGRTFLVSALFLILFNGVKAQTIIAVQDFEVLPAAPTWSITAGSGNISTSDGNGDTPSLQRIRGGSQSWQVVNSGTPVILDLGTVTTTGFSSIVVTLRISSTSLTGTNGADLTDTLSVSANVDGAGFPVLPDITVTGNTNARWGYNDTVNATTAAGTPATFAGSPGTNQGTIYSTLQITIPNGTNTVALRVTALNNVAQEIWNVDDVQIAGIAPTAAFASVTGRVVTKSGWAVSNAQVSALNAQSGATSYARTNPFGYFTFTGLPVGDFYIFEARSKGCEFPSPTTLQLLDDTRGIEIVGYEY